jgi:membrane protease YdiL (CAAX protease family)
VIICKPLGLTLKEAFARPGLASSTILFVWGAGLFCALNVLIVLYLLTLRPVLHWEVSFSNPALNTTGETVLNPNFFNIVSLWLHVAILSPIGEEIVFRCVISGLKKANRRSLGMPAKQWDLCRGAP